VVEYAGAGAVLAILSLMLIILFGMLAALAVFMFLIMAKILELPGMIGRFAAAVVNDYREAVR